MTKAITQKNQKPWNHSIFFFFFFSQPETKMFYTEEEDSQVFLKGNRGPHSFCFSTFYLEDEPSLRAPMHPMQSAIRVHSSHGTEQGDIDCFHFTGVSWDWHIMKAQQGRKSRRKVYMWSLWACNCLISLPLAVNLEMFSSSVIIV